MLDALQGLDESIFLALNDGLSAAWLDPIMVGLTWLGDGIVLALVLGAAVFAARGKERRRRLVLALVGVAAGSVVVHSVKVVVARPRPGAVFEQRARAGAVALHLVGSPPRGKTSWPSGHAQGILATALVLGELFRRWRWALIPLALLVALSRVYVGAHFPLDVLGGLAIGALSAGIAILIARRRARILEAQ